MKQLIQYTNRQLWNKGRPANMMQMTRYTLVLLVSLGCLVTGCATSNDDVRAERQVQRLMRHSSWPEIQQIALAEVNRSETLFGLPETHFEYIPTQHEEKVWVVSAISSELDGQVHRVVLITISDEGEVLSYQRHIEGI